MWEIFYIVTAQLQLGVTKRFNPYALSSISHFTNYIKEVFLFAIVIKIHVPCRDDFIKV